MYPFAFMAHASGAIAKKPFPHSRWQIVSPTFSSRNLSFRLGILVYDFELLLSIWWQVRIKVPSVICVPRDTQDVKKKKRPSFLHWMASVPLLRIVRIFLRLFLDSILFHSCIIFANVNTTLSWLWELYRKSWNQVPRLPNSFFLIPFTRVCEVSYTSYELNNHLVSVYESLGGILTGVALKEQISLGGRDICANLRLPTREQSSSLHLFNSP